MTAIVSLFLGLLLGYRWGKEDGRAKRVSPSSAPLTGGGSVRADLLEQAHQHMVTAQIEQLVGLESTDRDELEDKV